MTSPATYYVTPVSGEDPYRVVLTAAATGWIATVERESETWSFAIRDAGGKGTAWVDETLLSYDWEEGRLVVGGVEHPLSVESAARRRAGRLRFSAESRGRTREIRAPMPGLVVAVEVKAGEVVEAGAGLVVIEAMKMENEIVAPAAGIVREIGVEPGRTVEKDALLCRIEPGGPV